MALLPGQLVQFSGVFFSPPKSNGANSVLGQVKTADVMSCVRRSRNMAAVTSFGLGATCDLSGRKGSTFFGSGSALRLSLPWYGVPHVGTGSGPAVAGAGAGALPAAPGRNLPGTAAADTLAIVRGYAPRLSLEYSRIACPICRRLLAHLTRLAVSRARLICATL